MTTEEKKKKLKSDVEELIGHCYKWALDDVERAVNSGSIDIESWDQNTLVLPKIITTAIMQKVSRQYAGLGTRHENRIKNEVKNIQYFL